MPQHILVAHDLSPEADLALQRAARLARQSGSRLSLLHVQSAQLAAGSDDLRRQLEERLAACVLPRAELVLRHGPVAEEILRQARGLEADLLVLGAHHRGSPEGFAGTTLERILQRSPAPVLLAVGDSPWQRALVALDFSPCASRALRQAARLLEPGARLHALHVEEVAPLHAGDDPEELAFESELFEHLVAEERARLPGGLQLSHELRAGERSACLQAVLAEQRPQLLALGSHSRGELADALLGSLTLECLRHPPCDVLVAR
ncbi:Universal stress protein [Pseudomonas sp. OF001]|uniref:universal stress protein n=1 Tax=Pseudomonas sp. OF001 TaxID=2772300 RepID=UPI00191AF3BE|nr:universal stress protein [Pseudomonas sp. OF001]CAD5375414.1 Universal stress protein [Pseudomonas sp. OF001]